MKLQIGKKATRAVVTTVGTVLGVISMVGLTAGSAAATNGPVDSTWYSPNGGGSHATADIRWSNSHRVNFDNIRVNDFCPGDDKRAQLKFKVRYMGDSGWTTVGGTREDVGGCDSTPYTESTTFWDSSRAINDATVVACIQDRGCADPNDSYRDNPYTGSY